MTKDKALKLALEALEPEPYLSQWYVEQHVIPAAITAIKETLAQPDNQGKIQTVDSSTERKAD